MLKDVFDQYYFEGNYNCAETILRAGNDYFQLGLHDHDMKLVGAYGAGIQCGNTCGAILAGAAILSMKYVEKKAHESEKIRPVTVNFIRKLNQTYGSTLCKDIKPQSYQKEIRCHKTIQTVCDLLEQTIEEFESTTSVSEE